MTPGGHRAAMNAAYDAATLLRAAGATWHVVALHYAALHLIHADLLERPDVPQEMREPETHKSHWDRDGRQKWGLNDVVRHIYPPSVSRAYTTLITGSYAVRYRAPCPLGDRFWQEYERLRVELLPAE